VRIRGLLRRLCVTAACLLGVGAIAPCGTAAEPLSDLSGRWITVQRLTAVGEFPFLGRVTIRTTLGLFSEVTQTGSSLTLSDAYCFTDVDVSTPLFVTSIPDATMQSIRPDPRSAELRGENDGVWLVHDWHTEVRGAVLDDPVNDALPTYRSDPRVVDMESDGQIGFTIPAAIVGMFGGDTYVVQRFRYRLSGKLVDPDTIIGFVEWSTEQQVLWATDALLMMPYVQWIDPDPTSHRFIMRRIDGTWTCESVRERALPLLERLAAC